MLNNKTTQQRQKCRIGLIALAPIMATMAILPSISNAAIDAKAPSCKILSPKTGIVLSANQNVSFTAQATLKDKTASPLTYEWDFSGGVFGELIPNSNPPAYKRPEGLKTNVQFIRDNARYTVHFSAMDAQNRRCESTIEVVIGTPPTGLPNVSALVNESQKTTPKVGKSLNGKEGDVVVLPYPEMGMQAQTDARYQQSLYNAATSGSYNTLNAQVYSKGRQPQVLTKDDVTLRYAAASNKNDPVGKSSINSTSQNYPLGKVGEAAPFENALIQKTDMWELPVRPASDVLSKDYNAMNWVSSLTWGDVKTPDKGMKTDVQGVMPGIENPFVSNAFQDFAIYNEAKHAFTAKNIPITDIDDTGRVNPYPLMRVQAIDNKTQKPIANATVDAVVSAAKDFHCSECHEKGKIAANPEVDFSQFKEAFHSSPEYNNGYHCKLPACDKTNAFAVPKFYDAVDKNGKPSTALADREYAAVRNAGALHDFYDNFGINYFIENGGKDEATGEHNLDMVNACTGCHATMTNLEKGWAFNTNNGKKSGDMMYYPSFSEALHKYHGRLQLDPKDKTKILRQTTGRPLQWDDSKGANPNTLFPTVDAKGKSLPMEQSCLRCHSGHREQLYRDRMLTAGTTCSDCHGNMAAVGKAHDKPKAGQEGDSKRVEWLEEPNCGSCHMGDGNLGKTGTGKGGTSDAFSAGVMRRAFDSKDPSATPRKPLLDRFAVQPSEPVDIPRDDWVDPQYSTRHSVMTISEPLYRTSKDVHGDVACAACHGGSHEIWANRNPNANDNLTAIELQGHAGTISECSVCHTADAFKNGQDLDAGRFQKDLKPDSGVLGGPHNMHPVNDPDWWKSAKNTRKSNDHSEYTGWHDIYATTPGKDGENQCAACHGNDLKGTRLSKTPVARTFDFSYLDAEKLKTIGFKSSVIKVAANTQIGCDTCHTIEIACKNSPAGDQCGVASENFVMPKNHDPVITSKPAKLTAVMGETTTYQVQATDEDGDSLSYSLPLRSGQYDGANWAFIKDANGKIPSDMSISNTGLVTINWTETMFAAYKKGPFIFPYAINVSDGKGGYAVQHVEITLDCPAGKSWQWNGGMWNLTAGSCVANNDISFTSKPITSIDAGKSYSYKVVAKDAKNLPITYSLLNEPNGMTIDPKTGLVTWAARTVWYGETFYQVKATNSSGISSTQLVTLKVNVVPGVVLPVIPDVSTVHTCPDGKKWDTSMEMCM
ncbi:MAG: putative Ig domain-containing protein [Methylococcales bacterium]|nr:putative Ig domain-containing protein [Methylococcales bacterium]